jgi:hypothetical protein
LALNPTYSGLRVHDPHRTNGHKLSPTATFTPATWPALVDRTVFLAVKRRLTDPQRVTTRPGRGVHLASMVDLCDVCGRPLAVRNDKDREREYTCHRKGCVRVSYDGLNTFVEAAVIAYLSRPENLAWLSARDDDAELLAARQQVAEIRAEMDDLADQVGAGLLSATLAARAEPGIRARLTTAQAREAELTTPTALRDFIAPGVDVVRQWKSAPMSARREALRLLFTPELCGELRVRRSPTPGHRCPVDDRVYWKQTSAA